MLSVPKTLQTALRHHQGGEFEQAEVLYRNILRVDPRHADALHLLGLVAYQESKPIEAIDLMKRAIACNGSASRYHCHLGAAYRAAGDMVAAIDSYRRAISLDPKYIEAHYNLGNALRQQGEQSQAIEAYQTALRYDPRHLQARYNLGNIWKDLKNTDLAIAEYEQALAIDPRFVEALNNLGSVYHELHDSERARQLFARCIEINPKHSRAWNNLGNVHFSAGRNEDARSCFLKALEIDPRYVEALFNDSAVLKEEGRLDEAAAGYRRCLEMKSDYADARNNLGTVMQLGDRLDEALACYNAVLSAQPDHTQALYNRGNVLIDMLRLPEAVLCHRQLLTRDPEHRAAKFDLGLVGLLQGDWLAGWEGYEHRWCQDGAQLREFSLPEWNRQPDPNMRLFISTEQGVGDEIMFALCVPQIMRQVKSVILECDGRLMPLFQRSFPEIELVARPVDISSSYASIIQRVDAHIPSGSLPRACRLTPESVPMHQGYLQADAGRTQHWRTRLAALPIGRKIGISWRGGKAKRKQIRRSAPLNQWNHILSIPGAVFIDVQYGPTELDRQALLHEHQIQLQHFPEIDPLNNLDEFAALLSALDLVISIDNSTVHLAGALAVPTWAMLPYSTDWRWMLERSDTPWYPSVRLFRQQSPGSWAEPLAGIQSELESFLHQSHDA